MPQTAATMTYCDLVAACPQFPCDLTDAAQLAYPNAQIGLNPGDAATQSQIRPEAVTGVTSVVIETDGSTTDMSPNPKGLATADAASADLLVQCSGLIQGAAPVCSGGACPLTATWCSPSTVPGPIPPGTTRYLDAVQDSVVLSEVVTVLDEPPAPFSVNAATGGGSATVQASVESAIPSTTTASTSTRTRRTAYRRPRLSSALPTPRLTARGLARGQALLGVRRWRLGLRGRGGGPVRSGVTRTRVPNRRTARMC